jgi:hypothetical protein
MASILKASRVVDPNALDHSQRKDFAAIKSAVLLMGLPMDQVDEYISKVWHYWVHINSLDPSLQSMSSF